MLNKFKTLFQSHQSVGFMLGAALLAFAATTAQAGPNLVINGDTVYDKKTDLTWQRCSQGLRWNPATNYCVGVKKTMTFDEANRGWTNGWRMPTLTELKTLLEKKGEDGLYIDSKAFPDTGDEPTRWYWSSTPEGASGGWNVFFSDGSTSSDGRSATNAVRLVRGGQ